MKMTEKADKIIWITGSGRGIGRETALNLARRGQRVVISSRTQSDLDAVIHEAGPTGAKLMAQVCDVTDTEGVARLVRKVEKSWGPIDVLVNNAGVAVFKKLVNTSLEEWEKMMATNAGSAFLCTAAVLPGMIARQRGQIINVISVAGRQPFYNSGAYCASKYAMKGFNDVLRLETRKHGIQVTAFMPGATDTSIWGSSNADRQKMMKAAEVAQTLADLCCTPPSLMVEEVVMRPIGGDL